jgi:hypothetical protein
VSGHAHLFLLLDFAVLPNIRLRLSPLEHRVSVLRTRPHQVSQREQRERKWGERLVPLWWSPCGPLCTQYSHRGLEACGLQIGARVTKLRKLIG